MSTLGSPRAVNFLLLWCQGKDTHSKILWDSGWFLLVLSKELPWRILLQTFVAMPLTPGFLFFMNHISVTLEPHQCAQTCPIHLWSGRKYKACGPLCGLTHFYGQNLIHPAVVNFAEYFCFKLSFNHDTPINTIAKKRMIFFKCLNNNNSLCSTSWPKALLERFSSASTSLLLS